MDMYYLYMYIHIHGYTCIYTRIHMYIHGYTYIYTCVLVLMGLAFRFMTQIWGVDYQGYAKASKVARRLVSAVAPVSGVGGSLGSSSKYGISLVE